MAIKKVKENIRMELHTQITYSIDEFGNKRETKIVGNRKYVMVLYECGNKQEEKEYKDGKREGKWIGWWENGNKWYEREYKDGKKEGKWIVWHSDGDKHYEEEYNDGESKGKLWYEWQRKI